MLILSKLKKVRQDLSTGTALTPKTDRHMLLNSNQLYKSLNKRIHLFVAVHCKCTWIRFPHFHLSWHQLLAAQPALPTLPAASPASPAS